MLIYNALFWIAYVKGLFSRVQWVFKFLKDNSYVFNIAEIRKIKREKKNGTTSVTGEKESVPRLQKRVLMIEMGRRSWRRPTHRLR